MYTNWYQLMVFSPKILAELKNRPDRWICVYFASTFYVTVVSFKPSAASAEDCPLPISTQLL